MFHLIRERISNAWKGSTLEDMIIDINDLESMPLVEFEKVFKAVSEEANNRGVVLTIDEDGKHKHTWKRGMLPGQRYIKTCVCGEQADVATIEEWNRLG